MKTLTRRTCLKQVVFAAAASALPAFALEVEAHRPVPSELSAMAAIAQAFMLQYKVPGLSVSIAKRGQLVYNEGFGFANTTSAERMTPAHRFRIASISKPITSVALYSLLEQGRLKLDDLVFAPNGILGVDYGALARGSMKEITLHHLLTHTCGGWGQANDTMFLNPTMTQKELIAWTLGHQPLENKPGEHYAYSNFGYCVLGRVLEKVTGQPYADLVKKSVLEKCEIKDMQIAGNTLFERAAGEVVYYGQNGQYPYDMNVRRMDSHGGWLATAADLVQFASHVDGFKLLKKDTLKTMTTGTTANPDYASGWCINKVPNWWHGGSLPGTTTIMVRTASGLCWSALANTRTTGIDLALDQMIWKMASAVPAWQA